MEKDELQKTIIKIEGCDTKAMSNGKFMSKLRGSDGNNYVVFHTKKDGNKTKAFEALEQMPMSGINQYAEVAYKEEKFTKEGKDFVSRKAVLIRLSSQETTQSQSQPSTQEDPVDKIDFNKEEDGFLPIN